MLGRKRVARLCLIPIALGIAVLALAATIAPERAAAGDDCPNAPVVGPVIEGACDVAIEVGDAPDTALDATGGAVADVAGAAGEGILDVIANAMLDGAAWLLGAISSLIDATTEVRITGITTACEQHAQGQGDVTYPASCYEPVGWFGDAYGAMWGLAALFALGVLFVAAIDAVTRGQIHELVRLPLKVIVAFALTAAAIAITGMLLQLTDEMSTWIASSGGDASSDFFASNQDAIEALKGGDSANAGQPGEEDAAPVIVRMLVALAMVLGGLVVWIELLLRASAIFVGVFFLPFAIVAMIWPRTAATFRRVAEILLAVIFAKFGIVAVVALGGRAVVAAEGDVGQGLAGATILLLACLIPILFLHMAQFAVGAGVMGAAAGVGASAAVAAPMAATRGGMMVAIASRNWGTRAVSRLRTGGEGQFDSAGGPTGAQGVGGSGAPRGGPWARGPAHSAASQSGRTEAIGREPPHAGTAATPRPTPARPGEATSTPRPEPPSAPSRAERTARPTQPPPTGPRSRDRDPAEPPLPPDTNPARRPPPPDPLEEEL